jgi:hypothetical protein
MKRNAQKHRIRIPNRLFLSLAGCMSLIWFHISRRIFLPSSYDQRNTVFTQYLPEPRRYPSAENASWETVQYGMILPHNKVNNAALIGVRVPVLSIFPHQLVPTKFCALVIFMKPSNQLTILSIQLQ